MESTHYEILFVGLIFRKNEDGEPRAWLSNIQDEPDDAIDRRIRCSPTDTAGKAAKKTFRRAVQSIG
ncbi:hypothetical protein SAMN05443248_5391 [Bradyrhizobium erythrophlei]|uniref:Uncharacterized protein n=1 Tax=Bradyrhizobium erythrophlei TaxID=1437360 RepID=A0A1M5UDM5_9BRAD|nr:hypothetical protein SAMN05443248_5391 [Bradyrhizobium erythrophlei]